MNEPKELILSQPCVNELPSVAHPPLIYRYSKTSGTKGSTVIIDTYVCQKCNSKIDKQR